jgi:hypothetical protein
MNEDKKDKLIKQHEETIKRLQKELSEYYRVEQVIIAAGVLDKDKFDQAREIVQTFKA